MDDTILSINNISKKFGNITALKDFSVDVKKGEFITILGPSGCGKTTLLRIIDGLETPDSGSILLDGVDITDYPPEKRSVNTVFQNYALFPHLNVYENIAYGLKLNRISKKDICQQVNKVLELVQLTGYEKRKIHQLSGGQKQRVAIARALVLKPKVLLLDEPLGALDHKLRLSMQEELKKMQKLSGTTFIYITHDQDEALNLSDRIILMNNSCIEQIGTPHDIYNFPKNLYVSKFVGKANILTGENKNGIFDFGLFSSDIKYDCTKKVYAIIRPENVFIDENGITCKVISQTIHGGVITTEVMVDANVNITMHSFDTPILSPGENIKISVKNKAHYIFE